MSTTPQSASRVRAPEVMVSYSSQDRDRVMQFVRALRSAGVAVWIDQGGIDGAQRWSEEIVNAIEACRTVLLFISQNSMASQNIAKEVALAWESGKHFLPVALEEAKIPKSMQYQLAGIQYVKLYDGDPEAKFESVLRALVRLEVRVSPYTMAVVSAGIGEREQALEWLVKACDERSSGLARLKTEPRFNAMRGDPNFVDLAKRAEALNLESDEVTSEIVLPQPLHLGGAAPAASTGPAPTWKRLLWPDIVDAASARAAAAQGVWAAAAIIVCFWLISFFVPTSMMTVRNWFNDPIVLTVIWGAIGFAVQKMGRPAAIIGAGLCVLGAFFNLNMLSVYRSFMDAQAVQASMGQSLYGQPSYSALYYATLFGVVSGIAFVMAFVNASRGTIAYRQMVAAGRAQDKQDALSPQDLLGVRRKLMALIQRIWGSRLAAAIRSKAGAISSAAAAAKAARSKDAATQPAPAAAFSAPAASTPAKEVPPANAAATSVATPTAIEVIDQFPRFDDAPDVHTLADLVGSKPLDLGRAGAFLAANLVTGMVFMLSRALFLPGPLHPVYWQFAFVRAIVLTAAALIAFRFVRNGWAASGLAAALTTILVLVLSHFTLGTFTMADMFYREQFQEFILIPFVDVMVTLLGLYYLIPRLRPLAVGLWVGALGAEVATSMLITVLRDLGAGQAPDRVLAGTLIFFVGVRSLVFAAAFWAALKVVGIGKTAAS